ncbi:unnamed protein product, partial [Enterobius vermicularis]|uniref:Beta-lactamase domain-containing protein n=1 Tax=Enterobius vermicularis TaxID=51028 RepID=A0A0N4V8Q5_ENTVE
KNFEDGYEREGAHLSIYHKGKLVVNVWSGHADFEAGRLWTNYTKMVLFSATKAITSLCVAMLVDRGRLAYDDLVVKYWPKYGQFSKENTTIEDLLTHRVTKAGIPYLEDITMNDATDPSRIMEKLEGAKPLWKPGSASGYHAITFGWLVDGVFRKADEYGRDVKTFFKEEIADKYGLDIVIGPDQANFGSYARITLPGLVEYARDIFADPRMIAMLGLLYVRSSNSIAAKLRIHPSWIPLNYDTVALNDPKILSLNLPSVTGVANAENLARLFSMMLDGKLISNKTLSLISKPTMDGWHLEQVVLYPFVKGHGFFFAPRPIREGGYVWGHPGYGGQALNVDVEKGISFAYLTNGLKTGSGEMCKTYWRLLNKLYEIV